MARSQNAVVAMTGAICLGMLAGGTIPTRIKAPLGQDWRDAHGARGDPTAETYYVEPGPEDLSSPGDGPFALADPRPTWARNNAVAQMTATSSWAAEWQPPEPEPEPVPVLEPPTPRPIELPAEPAPVIAIEAPEAPPPERTPASDMGVADTPQGSATTITL